jgi:AraC-like DNA-binding protein
MVSSLNTLEAGAAAVSWPRFVEGLLGGIARLFAQGAHPDHCFSREVEEALVPLLATGEATAAQVADKLGVSRQTLYRRLQAEGTSFQELLAAKRRQLAIRYLGVERVPVKVAAWRLGFSSPAAFSRAFKRWTDISPGRFQSRALKPGLSDKAS